MLLFFSKAVNTSAVEIFIAFKRLVFMATSYCFKNPPQVLTSTTPFIPDNCLLTIQS